MDFQTFERLLNDLSNAVQVLSFLGTVLVVWRWLKARRLKNVPNLTLKTWAIIVVSLLIISSVIAYFAYGRFLFIPVRTPENVSSSTPTFAATSTPAPSIVPSTPTASGQPQASPIVPTPSLVPATQAVSSATDLATAEAAPMVYEDAMNDSNAQSTAGAGWDITTQCAFTANGYQTTTYQSKPAFCHEQNYVYQNALINMDVTIVSGGSAGLLFRDQYFSRASNANATGAYFFEIGADGRYKISTVPFEVRSTLQNWTQASAINTGPGVKNTLQVITQGNALSFYVNGTFLTTVHDETYTKGSISFACYTGSTSQTQAIFSNLKVHAL